MGHSGLNLESAGAVGRACSLWPRDRVERLNCLASQRLTCKLQPPSVAGHLPSTTLGQTPSDALFRGFVFTSCLHCWFLLLAILQAWSSGSQCTCAANSGDGSLVFASGRSPFELHPSPSWPAGQNVISSHSIKSSEFSASQTADSTTRNTP